MIRMHNPRHFARNCRKSTTRSCEKSCSAWIAVRRCALMGSSRSIVRSAKKGGGDENDSAQYRGVPAAFSGCESDDAADGRVVRDGNKDRFIGCYARTTKLWENATGAITYKARTPTKLRLVGVLACLIIEGLYTAGHSSPTGPSPELRRERSSSDEPRSSEDSLRFRAQLRPASGNRRRADYRNRNSVEKGAHRRKAPAPDQGRLRRS